MLKSELLRLDTLVYGSSMTIHKKIWSNVDETYNWELNGNQEVNNSSTPKASNKNLKKLGSPIKDNSGLSEKTKLHEK